MLGPGDQAEETNKKKKKKKKKEKKKKKRKQTEEGSKSLGGLEHSSGGLQQYHM